MIQIKLSEEISQILTGIGLEVESLDKVQAIPGGLEGLVIGYVKECSQHPNADRLRLTKVDVGTVKICRLFAVLLMWLPAKRWWWHCWHYGLPELKGEPFKINKSKIRGEVSEGMICAEDEIGLDESMTVLWCLMLMHAGGLSAQRLF